MRVEEHNPAHFQWMMVDNADQSVFAFEREVGESDLLFVYNMTPNYYEITTMSAAPTRASMRRSSIATKTSMAAGTNTMASRRRAMKAARRIGLPRQHQTRQLCRLIFKRKVAHLEREAKPPKRNPSLKKLRRKPRRKRKKPRRKRSRSRPKEAANHNINKESVCFKTSWILSRISSVV
jgi:hypothetical protein